jgi:hypothetical protein
MHQSGGRERRIVERIGLCRAGIGWRWWRCGGSIVVRCLSEDCGNVSAGLTVLLEPGIDLVLGRFTLARRGAVDEQSEELRKPLRGGVLRRQRALASAVNGAATKRVL